MIILNNNNKMESLQQNFTRYNIRGTPSTILGKFATLNFPSLPAMSSVFNLSRLSGLCNFILRVSLTDKVFWLTSFPSTMVDLKKIRTMTIRRNPWNINISRSQRDLKKKTKSWKTFWWMTILTYFLLKHLLKNSIAFHYSFKIYHSN